MNPLSVRVGLERSSDNRSLAWALDFPGAFSFGSSDAEAIEQLPESLIIYARWVGQHTHKNWVNLAKFDLQVEEKIDTLPTNEPNAFTAFFQDDRRPLERLEIEKALLIHAWQRQDLLEAVQNLTPEIMTLMLPGQRWNINGTLNHIGRTEIRCLGYLNLSLPGTEILVHNPFKLLELSYVLVQQTLPDLEGNTKVVEKGGEIWSARKLLRRLLWHQRDHIEHIHQIVKMANQV